ncbi:MAG: tetratricopeptide repeat protein, partial [Planctomycetes bacterium]|nr:tetratricopeptide repeat protein [Planctomycetota bacterium]
LRLGLVLLDRGEADEGREHLAAAVRIHPKDPSANYRYGLLLHREGKPDEAVVYYQRAVESDPEHVLAMLALAGIRIMPGHPDLNDPEKAVALAERACELTEHESVDALVMLAQIYAVAGRREDALRTGTEALKIAQATRDNALVRRIEKDLSLYQRIPSEKPE